MAERPEDLNLPITVVQRIIKEALPDGVIVSKEARQTICRASSVFVLYLTSCAVTHANKAKRKTLAVNDILSAIGDMEFDSFTDPLKEVLKYRKENPSAQANKKAASKSSTTKKPDGEEEEEEAIDEEETEEVEIEAEEEGEENEPVEEEAENDSERKNKKRKTDDENGENNANTFENQEQEQEENENSSDDESNNSANEID